MIQKIGVINLVWGTNDENNYIVEDNYWKYYGILLYLCGNFSNKKLSEMPLYDYGCKSCGNEIEVQHPISEIGKIEVPCDVCGQAMKKLLSAPSLLGFDNVGRSISKKDASTKPEKKSTKDSESKKAVKKDAA